jgi:hypothetical protein
MSASRARPPAGEARMAVNQQTPRNVSSATTGAVVFPYSFKIISASDLLVQVNGVTKTLGVHYNVDGVGLDGGGNITFIAPMAGGEIVMRKRQMAFSRLTDYQTLGDLLAPTLNNDQDAPVLMAQQLLDEVGRSLQIPVDSTFGGTGLPDPTFFPGYILGVKADGTGFEFKTGTAADTLLRDQLVANGAGSALVKYAPSAFGAVARTVRDRLADTYSVKDFGAKGDSVTDDSDAIQACINAVFVTGGTVFFPGGRYRTTKKLYLDVRGVTGAPNTNVRRVNFRGSGRGNTCILPNVDGIIALHIQGDNPLTSASHAYITISDLAFGGNSPTQRTCDGIKLEDLAYLTVSDVTFHNLNHDLVLWGCLASTFQNLVFNESATGVLADAGASGPHSNLWLGCEFRNLTSLAYNGFTSMSGATFINCRVEGCGTMGDSATGGMIFRLTGTAGEAGPTFIGGYIENNAGGFDINIQETGSQRVNANFFGSIFNRVDSANYVTNNILTSGDVDLNMSGCTFTSYNSYAANAARPYLNLSSTTRFRDFGNRYEDAVEAPILSQTLPYAGFVSGSLGATVTGVLPNGWTVSQVSTGIFQVTHNLGHTDYAINATTNTGNARVVERCVRSANNFQVKITTTANAASDDDFSFSLQVLKPIR